MFGLGYVCVYKSFWVPSIRTHVFFFFFFFCLLFGLLLIHHNIQGVYGKWQKLIVFISIEINVNVRPVELVTVV